MRYLLLLKRLIKKKSYIAMLLVVPLMVLMLNAVSSADAGLLTIGIYLPGEDFSSDYIKADLTDNPHTGMLCAWNSSMIFFRYEVRGTNGSAAFGL